MDPITEDKTVGASVGDAIDIPEDEKPQLVLPDEDAQRGVQDIEAVTLSWSKTALIAVFIK
jgi:hypothetical protein